MRRALTWGVAVGALIWSGAARAGTDFAFTVKIKDGRPSECVLGAKATDDKDDSLTVSLVNDKMAAATSASDLTVTIAREGELLEATVAIAKGKRGGKLESRGAYENRKVSLAAAGVPVESAGCTQMLAAASAGAGAAGGRAPAREDASRFANVDASEINQKAMAYLASRNIVGHGVEGGALGKHFRLYHLPDGTPAFPLPAHISEKDHVEIWLALPVGAKAGVEVVACDKVPGYRIKGSYKDVAEKAGKLHGLEEVTFALQAYANQLQCAGTLTYKIETSGEHAGGSTTTSITIDPVYRFEWGVGFGFDFGSPTQLSLGDRPAAGGTGTEKFIVATDDFTGAKPIITLGVDVCGTNPADMTWCDRLLMPTAWVDPTRLDEGFGVGLTFRPLYGVGILVGMSVFQSTGFANGLSAAPGDTWTATGDLPTKQVFNKDSIGLMLAATLDTEVFAALVP